MVCRQQNFYEQNQCGVYSYCHQNNPFLSFPWHEKVNVEENKGQNRIIEKPTINYVLPVSDENNFLDQVPKNSLSFVAFRSP